MATGAEEFWRRVRETESPKEKEEREKSEAAFGKAEYGSSGVAYSSKKSSVGGMSYLSKEERDRIKKGRIEAQRIQDELKAKQREDVRKAQQVYALYQNT